MLTRFDVEAHGDIFAGRNYRFIFVPLIISQSFGGPNHESAGSAQGQISFLIGTKPEPITIDIKPGNRLDCLNQNPVVVFGNLSSDVTSINIDTLVFGDQQVDGRVPLCSTDYVNDDEHLDLVCKFVPGTGEAMLSGEFVDGTQFQASDTICAAQ